MGDHFHDLVAFLAQEFKRPAQHVGIERAAQAAFAGSHQHQDSFFRALRQQRKLFRIFDARHRRAQNFANARGVGPQRHRGFLRATQPCRGDEFHRARDLLRILHRTNSPPEIEKCGHGENSAPELRRGPRRAGLELLLEFADGALQFRAGLVGNLFFLSDLRQQRAVARVHELNQVLLEALNVRHGNVVDHAAGAREDHQDLLLDRQRRELALLQDFDQPLPARELRLRGLIELIGAELREGREFAVLREVQAQRAGHLPHGLDLRVAADAAHRKPTLIAGRMPLLNKSASR